MGKLNLSAWNEGKPLKLYILKIYIHLLQIFPFENKYLNKLEITGLKLKHFTRVEEAITIRRLLRFECQMSSIAS